MTSFVLTVNVTVVIWCLIRKASNLIWRRRAEARGPRGQISLAYHYKVGHRVPRNWIEAARLFELAAKQGKSQSPMEMDYDAVASADAADALSEMSAYRVRDKVRAEVMAYKQDTSALWVLLGIVIWFLLLFLALTVSAIGLFLSSPLTILGLERFALLVYCRKGFYKVTIGHDVVLPIG